MDTPIRRAAVEDASGTSWQALCRLGLLVGALAVVPTASQAQNADGMEVRAYGAVGLAQGETVSLTVVNLLSPILVPPNPCRVHLAFVDAAGAAWPGSNRQPASRTADLLPGESLTLTLSFDDIRAAVMGLRAAVRGIVASPAPSVPPSPCLGLARGLVARLNASRVSLPSRSGELPPTPA